MKNSEYLNMFWKVIQTVCNRLDEKIPSLQCQEWLKSQPNVPVRNFNKAVRIYFEAIFFMLQFQQMQTENSNTSCDIRKNG